MPRRNPVEAELERMCRGLTAIGEGAPGDAQKLELLGLIRSISSDAPALLDRHVVRMLDALATESREKSRALNEIRAVVDRLTAPPRFPAILLGLETTSGGPAALVKHGNTRSVVAVAAEVERELEQSAIGDEVLLAHDQNVVVALSPYSGNITGEIDTFDRRLPDGRLVVRHCEEEVVLQAAGELLDTPLEPGDLVRWDRDVALAFEKVERSRGEHRFLEETPSDTFEEIGGLDAIIDQLKWAFRMHAEHAAVAESFGVRAPRSVLLTGPPGNGKTKIARALSNWIAGRSSSGRALFMNIKPSGLHSMWHGQSEANVREAFRCAREAARREGVTVIMFFDEVDSSGAMRGTSVNQVDDRVARSLMAELDGVEQRGDVFVIAATNRSDILDPALTRQGRLGDLELQIPRPGRDAGREILEKYVSKRVPLAEIDGETDPTALRATLIDATTSRMYAPNAGTELCRLTLRSGARRTVRPADLVSGALLARLASAAAEDACRRRVETGQSGLRLTDFLAAADAIFDQASRLLTPANCRSYLEGIPQDDDVMAVERSRPRVERRHRFLKIA